MPVRLETGETMKKEPREIPVFLARALTYFGLWKTVVDIGSNEIRILSCVKFLDKLFFLRTDKIQYSNKEELENCITGLSASLNGSIQITLSTASVNTFFLIYPGITSDRLKSLIVMDLEKRLPVPLERVYYNFKVVPFSSVNNGNSWNVITIAAKKEEIDQYTALFKRLNLRVESVYYLPVNIIKTFCKIKQNLKGYIVISESLIEIYILKDIVLINYLGLSGRYSENNRPAQKNIMEFFSSMIKQNIIPDEIVIVNKTDIDAGSLSKYLSGALNIKIINAGGENFQNFINRTRTGINYYDMLGFVFKRDHSTEIAPMNMRVNRIIQSVIKYAVISLILLDIAALLIFSAILPAEKEYDLIRKARNPSALTSQDDKIRNLALKIKNIDDLHRYQLKIAELQKKIKIIKSTGMESSRIKIVLAEIARLIPDSVWLVNLNIINQKGDMEGYSIASEGLEEFVSSLTGSKIFDNVVLKKAELAKGQSEVAVKFEISFGARK